MYVELVILRECEAGPDKGKGLRTLQMQFQPDGKDSFLYCRGEDEGKTERRPSPEVRAGSQVGTHSHLMPQEGWNLDLLFFFLERWGSAGAQRQSNSRKPRPCLGTK